MILQGTGASVYTEPGNSVLTAPSSENPTLLTASSGTSSCNDAAVEPPASFGSAGPEAFYSVCSSENVNRFKNLEIKFSHPVNQSTFAASFSVMCNGSALPGPAPGGALIWKSPQRLIFDPYRELPSNASCVITIANSAETIEGEKLISYSKNFSASHDYLISATVTQGPTSIPLGGTNDVTFSKSGDLILTSSFVNPAGAFTQIKKIVFNKMGNVDSSGNPNSNAKTVCEDSCTSLLSPINLSTDSFMTGSMALTEGGNTYYFDITTAQNSRIQRYFSFNYGYVNSNPSALINNVASGVLDESQMMNVLKRMIETFIKGKFRVSDAGTPKTFNQFASQPMSSSKDTSKCINYGSFSFITSYGDNPSGGYCGGNGENPGGFQAVTGAGCFGNATLDMDVYVTGVSIPGFTGGVPTVEAALGVNSNGEVGIDLKGRKAYLNLAIIAKNRDSMLCLVGSGNKFHFSTSVELNAGNSILRLARSRNTMSVDSSGKIVINVKTPYTPNDALGANFYVSEWVNNLSVAGVSLVDSTSWVSNLLSFISEAIGNGVVPQVQPGITQSVLKDMIQKITPNVLNAIVGNLMNPGVDIKLPDYLPAPLANYPLNAKIQLSTDASVRSDGTNKGIVASVHAAITSKNPLAPASQRGHANGTLCGASGCMVYTKNPAVPLINPSTSAPFAMSAANPGFLLALHSDAVTQAAYHLWKNRAIDINVDSAFISTVNSYAGSDPLLKLTDSLLRASAIMSIIAPGQSNLQGIDNSNNLLPAICQDDQVRFKIDPVMPPVAKMIDNSGFDATVNTPNLNVTFSDLQVTIEGKRTDNSAACIAQRGTATNAYYTMASLRVSMNANASMRFTEFDNPNTVGHDRLNALSLRIFTDGMKYSIEVLEGQVYNPYGLDPNGIKSVFNPMVKSLVVPLVNSILNSLPLPAQLDFNALTYPAAGTACKISTKTDNSIMFVQKTVPAVDASANPYLLAQATLMGAGLADPETMLEANCR
ncbi:MAG TPA: hypothetical protein PK453_06690 [Leptospiraceae bacterium]|nr:hypothetical protein [Leptospiraceae bacterium]HNF13338.1 hypothetical protein [Leptospiraceae bacterium]HNF22830.1 hypothetical protein [Leptospiraceae bacterium]HNI97507.1 hypothetical protein [Leptospiraceae bacterium]